MFFLALFLLIVLAAAAGVIIVQNFPVLFEGIHLTIFSRQIPGVPVLVLCLLGACIGGLLLYVVSSISARRDLREIKKLRAKVSDLRTRVEELEEEKAQAAKSPNNAPLFPAPAIPFPGFTPASSANPTGPLGQRQMPNSLQNLPPSASGNNLSLPRQFPPLPQTGQTGSPQPPPFPRQ